MVSAVSVSVVGNQIDPAYVAQLMKSRMDDSLLVDVIEAYASEHFADSEEREDFIAEMIEPPYAPLIKKATADVVFSVIAASELPTDEAFRALVSMLAVEEDDDRIRDMKRILLRSMVDDSEMEGNITDNQFRERMSYLDSCLG